MLLTVVIVTLLPVLYVLSVGPVNWLLRHGYISEDFFSEGGFAWVFYTPLRWMNENYPPFSSAMYWYTSLFIPLP